MQYNLVIIKVWKNTTLFLTYWNFSYIVEKMIESCCNMYGCTVVAMCCSFLFLVSTEMIFEVVNDHRIFIFFGCHTIFHDACCNNILGVYLYGWKHGERSPGLQNKSWKGLHMTHINFMLVYNYKNCILNSQFNIIY